MANSLGEEFIQTQYYSKNNDVNTQKWIDTHRSIKISLEWWLSKLLFKGDTSRVMYATQDIAFQKRINTLDKEKNADGVLRAESLDLPYACYWNSEDPEPDDRMAAVNASQAVKGIYYEDEDLTMRSTAMMSTYKIVCFFDRRDSVREAYQLLTQEKVPFFPVHLHNTVMWRGIPILMPTNLTVESITTNPNYKQTDWLTKHRIFMIEIEVKVRYYNLLINNVGKVIQLPIRFGNWEDTFEEDEEHVDYFTEEVILKWAPQKFGINLNPVDIDESNTEYKEKKWKLLKDAEISDEDKEAYKPAIPNLYTTDIIKAYFDDDNYMIDLCDYHYDEEKSTPTTAHFTFHLDGDVQQSFSKLIFSIPTKEDIEVRDLNQTEIDFGGLQPNSEYRMSIRVFDTSGHLNVHYLSFKTKNSKDNKAPQPEKINFFNGLAGMHI